MAYDVYSLQGFIVDIEDVGEYDKNLLIFSEEKGFIRVKAISAGKPYAKMRSFIIRFNCVDFDVVHGKTGYRLIKISNRENFNINQNKISYFAISKFEKLNRLFMPANVPHYQVYELFKSFVNYFKFNLATEQFAELAYYQFAMKLFFILGYSKDLSQIGDVGSLKKTYQEVLVANGIFDVL